VGAHPVALAVDVEHDAAMEQRSSIAAATIGSSKIFPQELTPRFVVTTIELFR